VIVLDVIIVFAFFALWTFALWLMVRVP